MKLFVSLIALLSLGAIRSFGGQLSVVNVEPAGITATSATFRASVTGTNRTTTPTVIVCWGPHSAGTGNSTDLSQWANKSAIGPLGQGATGSVTVYGLTSNTIYAYRALAIETGANYSNAAWSASYSTMRTAGLSPPLLAVTVSNVPTVIVSNTVESVAVTNVPTVIVSNTVELVSVAVTNTPPVVVSNPLAVTNTVTTQIGGPLDAFFRVPVSSPFTIFDSVFSYSTLPIIYEPVGTNGSATVTHLPLESSISLANSSNSWRLAHQTRQWWKYAPGKSQLFLMTAVLPSSSTNQNMVQRLGQFSDHNGLYWVRSNGVMGVAIRSSTSGSAVDSIVWRSQWTDPLDGSGPSGLTYNFNDYGTIFGCRYQWLGYGSVTFFIVSGGGNGTAGSRVLPVFTFDHAGSNKVYMGSATLPLRWEALNAGSVSGTNHFIATCASILSEGGGVEDEWRTYKFSAANLSDVSINATPTLLISLRPATNLYSSVSRQFVIPTSYELQAGSASYYQVVYGAVVTGGTWFKVSPDSGVEISTNSTTATGGRVIYSGFLTGSASQRGAAARDVVSRLPIALDNAGVDQSLGISIIINTISGNSASRAAINWDELR